MTCPCGSINLPIGSKYSSNGLELKVLHSQGELTLKLVHDQDVTLNNGQTFITTSEKCQISEDITITGFELYRASPPCPFFNCTQSDLYPLVDCQNGLVFDCQVCECVPPSFSSNILLPLNLINTIQVSIKEYLTNHLLAFKNINLLNNNKIILSTDCDLITTNLLNKKLLITIESVCSYYSNCCEKYPTLNLIPTSKSIDVPCERDRTTTTSTTTSTSTETSTSTTTNTSTSTSSTGTSTSTTHIDPTLTSTINPTTTSQTTTPFPIYWICDADMGCIESESGGQDAFDGFYECLDDCKKKIYCDSEDGCKEDVKFSIMSKLDESEQNMNSSCGIICFQDYTCVDYDCILSTYKEHATGEEPITLEQCELGCASTTTSTSTTTLTSTSTFTTSTETPTTSNPTTGTSNPTTVTSNPTTGTTNPTTGTSNPTTSTSGTSTNNPTTGTFTAPPTSPPTVEGFLCEGPITGCSPCADCVGYGLPGYGDYDECMDVCVTSCYGGCYWSIRGDEPPFTWGFDGYTSPEGCPDGCSCAYPTVTPGEDIGGGLNRENAFTYCYPG